MLQSFKTNLSLLFLFIASFALSQTPVITIGDQIELGKKDNMYYTSYSNEAVYVIKVEKEKGDRYGTLLAFSRRDLKQAFSFPITVPRIDAETFKIEGLYFYTGKLNFFYSYYSKKEQVNKLMLVTYDQTGKPIGAGKDLLKSDVDKESKTGYFVTDFNKETGNTVCMHFLDKTIAQEKLITPEVQLLMISASGEIAYQKKVKLSDDDHFELAGYTSDKFGNVYFAAYPYIMQVYKKPNMFYVFDATSKSVSSFDMVKTRISGKEKLIRRGIFTIDKNNNVFFFDQFSGNLNGTDGLGIFAARFDAQQKQLKTSFLPYNTPPPGEKPKKNGKYELTYFNPQYATILNDNSIRLFFEKSYFDSNYYLNSSFGLLASISNDLSTLKQSYLNKDLSFTKLESNIIYSIPFQSGNTSYMLFNSDFKENKPGEIETKYTNRRHSLSGCIGKFDDDELAQVLPVEKPLLDKKFLFVAESFIKADSNEIFAACELEGQLRVCKISEK